ncbi:MAG: hypothetical protein JRN52_01645 [Nitrososphaerota archaeon]|nr:hypothetical protein [Nitrososphaerota archaeon]
MQQSLVKRFSFADTFSSPNLVRLALMSVLFTIIDTIQSFYAQKVINVFTEFNFLPSLFYKQGALGYALYAPIECVAMFAMFSLLWLWASYVLWFHQSVVSKMSVFNRQQN